MKTVQSLTAVLLMLMWVAAPADVQAEEAGASASATAAEVSATADEAVQTVDEAATVVEQAGAELKDAAETLELQAPAEAQVAGHAEAGEMAYSAEGMADWLAMNEPGEHHEKLAPFVGEWDVATKFWFAPGMPAQESTGGSKVRWILDGRFIQEDFNGHMAMPGMEPQPFKGFGITGYDNMKSQYVSIWSDTMSTGLMQSAGNYDQSTGILELISKFDDPMTGEPTSMRMTHKVIDENTLLMKAFSNTPDGDEYQCLEITYTRKP